MTKQKLTTEKTEAALQGDRNKVLEQVAAIDHELAGIAERHAMELAADKPDEKRLAELEEIRGRFNQERERLLGRANAIGGISIPAAQRRAAHETMIARVAEYERLREQVSQGNALVMTALTELRRVYQTFPWDERHPQGVMETLAEEIGFDAIEAGVEPPPLEKAPRLRDEELGELLGLARHLIRRVEYLHHGWPGPRTARGRTAELAKRKAQHAETERQYAANAARQPM